MTSYNDMEAKILNHEAFKGNSVEATKCSDGSYIIRSYWTKILIIEEDGTIIFNDQFYSMTTRRIQGIIARLLSRTHNFKYETWIGRRGGLHTTKDAVYRFDGEWERIDGNANFSELIYSL